MPAGLEKLDMKDGDRIHYSDKLDRSYGIKVLQKERQRKWA